MKGAENVSGLFHLFYSQSYFQCRLASRETILFFAIHSIKLLKKLLLALLHCMWYEIFVLNTDILNPTLSLPPLSLPLDVRVYVSLSLFLTLLCYLSPLQMLITEPQRLSTLKCLNVYI